MEGRAVCRNAVRGSILDRGPCAAVIQVKLRWFGGGQEICCIEPGCSVQCCAPAAAVRAEIVLQVGNIQLAIPVRLIRKNKVAGSEFGEVYIYDGLYDVVRPFLACKRP